MQEAPSRGDLVIKTENAWPTPKGTIGIVCSYGYSIKNAKGKVQDAHNDCWKIIWKHKNGWGFSFTNQHYFEKISG